MTRFSGFPNIGAVYGLLPTSDAFTRARAAADRALALEPTHAHALTVRVLVALWFDWDHTAAEAFGRRAVAVGDGMAAAHEQLGWALLAAGQFDEAERETARALALDPLSAATRTARVFSQIIGGRHGAAVSTVDDWLARWPLDAEAHRLRGLAFEAADRPHEACDAFRRAGELDPANRFVAGNLAATMALTGQCDEARRIVTEMEAAAVDSSPPAMMLALAYHALGDDARRPHVPPHARRCALRGARAAGWRGADRLTGHSSAAPMPERAGCAGCPCSW